MDQNDPPQQTAFSIIDRLWSERALSTDAFFFSLFFCLVVAFLLLERIVVEEEENIYEEEEDEPLPSNDESKFYRRFFEKRWERRRRRSNNNNNTGWYGRGKRRSERENYRVLQSWFRHAEQVVVLRKSHHGTRRFLYKSESSLEF